MEKKETELKENELRVLQHILETSLSGMERLSLDNVKSNIREDMPEDIKEAYEQMAETKKSYNIAKQLIRENPESISPEQMKKGKDLESQIQKQEKSLDDAINMMAADLMSQRKGAKTVLYRIMTKLSAQLVFHRLNEQEEDD